MTEFRKFPKIKRLDQALSVTVTEKLDGTNACVIIGDDGEFLGAQSRNKLITPEEDNAGFARWAYEKSEVLKTFGPGHHFGEWCGPGVQKNPLGLDEKYFYLFNTHMWGSGTEHLEANHIRVVPILWEGAYTSTIITEVLDALEDDREYTPEGVMIYFQQLNSYLKETYVGVSKWMQEKTDD